MSGIEIRLAEPSDMDFVTSLSPRLANVPGPAWHTTRSHGRLPGPLYVVDLRSDCIGRLTDVDRLVRGGRRLGYIHMRPGKDGVTDEPCGYVSLLALGQEAEGTGVARRLMAEAETWARSCGYRFLSLDVYADNKRAIDFYTNGGFKPETIRLVKPL